MYSSMGGRTTTSLAAGSGGLAQWRAFSTRLLCLPSRRWTRFLRTIISCGRTTWKRYKTSCLCVVIMFVLYSRQHAPGGKSLLKHLYNYIGFMCVDNTPSPPAFVVCVCVCVCVCRMIHTYRHSAVAGNVHVTTLLFETKCPMCTQMYGYDGWGT